MLVVLVTSEIVTADHSEFRIYYHIEILHTPYHLNFGHSTKKKVYDIGRIRLCIAAIFILFF